MLALAASRPPTLGAGRLVCVDGPAGSGKTTLARALARDLNVAVRFVDSSFAQLIGDLARDRCDIARSPCPVR